MNIVGALARGYTPHIILNRLAQANPQYARTIYNAQAAGYAADTILRGMVDKKDPQYESADRYLTEHEKTRKNDTANKRKAAVQAIGLLGTAGAAAAGAYQLYNMNQAIQPSQILPAQRGRAIGHQPVTLQGATRGRGGPPPQLGGPQQQSPQRPPPGRPPQLGGPQQPQQPKQQQSPQNILQQNPIVQKNYNLVKNIGEEDRFQNMASQGLDIATTAQLLRQVTPKSKLALLEKAEGGLEGVLANFMLYEQLNPPAQRQQFQPNGRQGNVPAQQSGQMPQVQPGQEGQAQQAQQMEQAQQPEQMQQGPMGQAQEEQGMMQPEPEMMRPPAKESMQKISQGIGQQQKAESPEVKRQRYAIAAKRAPDETPEEFTKRKMLNDTLKAAAKIISSGQSFADLPYRPEAQYSTAKDVLQFLAGVPTVFDDLLDDEEKSELFSASEPKGIESSIQGSHMTPNLVWNLILSVNPKAASLAPPSIKGSKGAKPGGKMGTTEARRFLTHAVYGILGGKTVSFELADKIDKISEATSALDEIANAAAQGNVRKIEDALSKLDPEIFSILDEQLDEKIPESLAWMKKKVRLEEKPKEKTKKTKSKNENKRSSNKIDTREI